jgi:hypothetical protein
MNQNLRDLTEKKRIFFVKNVRNLAQEYDKVINVDRSSGSDTF